ncbi:MAG: hypothetical protein LBJ67_07365 [Planctomycetaceae bacterium]|jgi:hypothetical protein|nr:hypothetical protein [Planctomycetaceae bacterium]
MFPNPPTSTWPKPIIRPIPPPSNGVTPKPTPVIPDPFPPIPVPNPDTIPSPGGKQNPPSPPDNDCPDVDENDCSKQRKWELNQPIKAYCDGQGSARTCTRNMSYAELVKNKNLFKACVEARQKVIDECYKGIGDANHRGQIKNKMIGLQKCQNFIDQYIRDNLP